jgi:hypothetical protein
VTFLIFVIWRDLYGKQEGKHLNIGHNGKYVHPLKAFFVSGVGFCVAVLFFFFESAACMAFEVWEGGWWGR